MAVGVVFRIVDLYGGANPFFGGKGIKVEFGGNGFGQGGSFGEFIGCSERLFLVGGRRSRNRSWGVGCFGGSELFRVAGSLFRIEIGLLGSDFVFMFMLVVVVVLGLSVGRGGRGRCWCWLNLDDFGDGLDSGCTANSFVYSGNESRGHSGGFFLGDERRRLVAVGKQKSD